MQDLFLALVGHFVDLFCNVVSQDFLIFYTAGALREGCGKSKWKFKMAFAMKEGGSRGGLECHIPILKNDFFKNHFESFPDCENVFCT